MYRSFSEARASNIGNIPEDVVEQIIGSTAKCLRNAARIASASADHGTMLLSNSGRSFFSCEVIIDGRYSPP